MATNIKICSKCLEKCLERKFEFMTTTSEFDEDFCQVCTFEKYDQIVPVTDVKSVKIEACDCIERYGRIMHWNGGNYHRSTYTAYLIKI